MDRVAFRFPCARRGDGATLGLSRFVFLYTFRKFALAAMQILSAVDAISPAFERMKLVLYSPFRKGRTWKLSVTGYLAAAGTIFLPFTLIYGLIGWMFRDKIPPVGVTIIVAATLVLTALYVFIFVLCSRLQFAFFDIVLNR